MIVVDASSIPEGPSGVRTRLRGLYRAYGALEEAPAVTLLVASGSSLLDGLPRGSVKLREVPEGGRPGRRAWRLLLGRRSHIEARLWHSETIPPLGPAGVPALLTLHDHRYLASPTESGRSWLAHGVRQLAYRAWLPRLIHGLAAVVTVSPATATKFREEFPQQQERIHCVANATAGDRPDAPSVALVEKSRAAISIPAEPFLVAVGHLRRRKGLELVLQALARLSEKPCQLLVIGEGPERRPLQQLARKLGVATQVCFLGPLDDPSVDTLLQRATGLLFPSRLEGFGFPVFEALARSCPVVATPLPPWEKWCGPGLTCVQRDADCWAQALAELLEDPAAAREGALQLGRRLRSGTWKLAAEQLRDLYTSLLSPRAL